MAEDIKGKNLRERSGIELRSMARKETKGTTAELAAAALDELRRRIGNLRWAVIPEWERELRGQRIDEWDPLA